MNKVAEEFVSKERKRYKFKIGRFIASSLAGFITGFIVSSIIWGVFYYFLFAG